ncbi:MAG: hypothetical protein KBI08_13250 [Sphingobium sp.]|nr:hypothetical protein [Sphingobium sp.]MBP9158950.1 hypothetical protein [Sphingobium sp.]
MAFADQSRLFNAVKVKVCSGRKLPNRSVEADDWRFSQYPVPDFRWRAPLGRGETPGNILPPSAITVGAAAICVLALVQGGDKTSHWNAGDLLSVAA